MKLLRHQYIVNKSFQWKFVLNFIVALVIGNGLSTVVFITLAMEKLDELQLNMHVTAKSTGEIMRPLFFWFTFTNLLMVLVLFIVLSVRMKKKMNGPLYRISKDLERVAEGDFSTSIAVRGQDEFANVAETLDEMVSKLKERLMRFREKYKNISGGFVDLEVSQARGTGAKEQAKEMILSIEKLKQERPLSG